MFGDHGMVRSVHDSVKLSRNAALVISSMLLIFL
ncbi:hypothetical protein B178_04906 [Corynebacterium diphtheriae DSM 43988]|nr:hypothetical protein W5M_05116 [Corynebacterium diphtheriae bv. intermedius str. NCTC 5011]ERA53333.1 hypothetical protein B179_04782 [Corynebacterium diphtheriae str. Aberdeen]ERA56050.1 hypothetical protein B178_04906 [Corynebacterium diphtheriae DSM 43988]